MKKFFGGNAIGNAANQKSTTLPRPDDSGQYFTIFLTIGLSLAFNRLIRKLLSELYFGTLR